MNFDNSTKEQQGASERVYMDGYKRGYRDSEEALHSAYIRIGHYMAFLEQIDTWLDGVIIGEVDIERIKKVQSALREQLKQERLKQEINL